MSQTTATARPQRETAEQAFMAVYATIQERITLLAEKADDHFGVDPDRITWGDVGDLGRINQQLYDLLRLDPEFQNG